MLADEHTVCDILFLIGVLGFVESALYVPCGSTHWESGQQGNGICLVYRLHCGQAICNLKNKPLLSVAFGSNSPWCVNHIYSITHLSSFYLQIDELHSPLTDSPFQRAPLVCLLVSSHMTYMFPGSALPPPDCQIHMKKILLTGLCAYFQISSVYQTSPSLTSKPRWECSQPRRRFEPALSKHDEDLSIILVRN